MKNLIKKCLPTYKIVEKIGEGIHGSVYSVEDRFKQRAVKIVPIRVERSMLFRTETDLDSKVSQDFHAVREYYEKIKGEGVISIYDFHLVDKKISKKEALAHLVILMELCPANLQDFVIDNYPLDDSEIIRYMKDLALVLDRLSKGANTFLLTDFKPSNLLLSEDKRIMIGDLGGLKRLSSVSTIANAQFTPNWSAPELVMLGERPTVKSAIYSYGLVAYYLWEGQQPNEKEDFVERIRLIKEKDIKYENSSIPEGIRALILRCLSYEPDERPNGFKEVLEILSDSELELQNESTGSLGAFDGDSTKTVEIGKRPLVQNSVNIEERIQTENWFEPITNMEFLWVPGGTFKMGCLDSDTNGLPNEKPAHSVDVSGFWIAKYPVTQEQWRLIMNHNPSHFVKTPKHPVEKISWKAAVSFCSKLSAGSENNRSFKLPSEKQWEYAAKSCGKEELYAGGSNINDLCWFKENSGHSTQAVGLKDPNGIGLFDMSGNVMEWCEDIYQENIFSRSGVVNEGTVSNLQERVARGGGWNVDSRKCRVTARRRVAQALEYTNLGLRLVMVLE